MSRVRSLARLRALLLSIVILFLGSCDRFSSVPTGRIRIKNDLGGKEHSSYTVSGGGMTRTLRSGESVLLPSGTRRFSINYRAREGNRHYSVQCPGDSKLGITIRLIDAHSNRMGGRCQTIGGGRG